MNDMDLEQISMALIVNSGEARSLSFQALEKAREHDYEGAKQLMERSQACSLKAHKEQSQLLYAEANGNAQQPNVLLIHAQDHLMTSLLAQELIQEMIHLYQTKADKEC